MGLLLRGGKGRREKRKGSGRKKEGRKEGRREEKGDGIKGRKRAKEGKGFPPPKGELDPPAVNVN